MTKSNMEDLTSVFSNEEQAEKKVQEILEHGLFENAEQAKALIDALHYRLSQGRKVGEILAQALEANIRTVFSSSRKYVYELLQNADDAKAEEVEIKIIGDSLLFSHSGQSFHPCDVEKICNYALSSGDKSNDINKTGYKGVGFKANFCISNKITIISNHSCFRFDEGFFTDAKRLPWPIMPIWTERQEVERKLTGHLDSEKTHFYLENIKRDKVEEEINEIFKCPEVLLLLRNIKKVRLTHSGIEIVREKKQENIVLKVFYHGKCVYEKMYLLYDRDVLIPEDERAHLLGLKSSECPEKLKSAEKVKITFAVELDSEHKPMPATNAKLFSYLPTDIMSSLPFWVNAEFLLKQDRGSLLDNHWNNFLIKKIGELQFEVLEQIAMVDSIRNRVLALLPNSQLDNHQLAYFKTSYAEGFNKGKERVAFIPAMDNRLLKLHECFIDDMRFFDSSEGGFTLTHETKALFPQIFVDDRICIANYQLEEIKKLREHCRGRVFSVESLSQYLEEYVKLIYPDHKEALKKLLVYLFENSSIHLENALQEKQWLPSISGRLHFPKECFIANEPNRSWGHFWQINLIDESIFPAEPILCSKIKKWFLEQLKAPNIDYINMIRSHFLKLIHDKQVKDFFTSKAMLDFIFSGYAENREIASFQDLLKQIGNVFPIYIRYDYSINLSKCLVPACFDASSDFTENRIPDAYIPQTAQGFEWLWKEMILCMGVITQLGLKFYFEPGQNISISIQSLNCFLQENALLASYSTYCKTQYKNNISGIFTTGSHKIENLIGCDFIDKIHLPGYREIFWKQTVEYAKYIFNCQYLTPRAEKKEEKITPFLRFCLEKYGFIKDIRSGSPYSSQALYSPVFNKEFENFPFLVADIPEFVSSSILKELGFKIELAFEDALAWLISYPGQYSVGDLGKIYKAILNTYNENSEKHSRMLEEFIEDGQMLSSQGEHKKVSELYWFDLQVENTPSSDLFFDTCNLSFEQARKIASIFKLKNFSDSKELSELSITSLDKSEEESIIYQLKCKVLDFLHIATLLIAENKKITRGNENEIDEIAHSIYQKFTQLELVCYRDYAFAYQEGNEEELSSEIITNGHKITFTKNAYDDDNIELIDAIFKILLSNEGLVKRILRSMRPARKEKVFISKFGQDVIDRLKNFFSNKKLAELNRAIAVSEHSLQDEPVEQLTDYFTRTSISGSCSPTFFQNQGSCGASKKPIFLAKLPDSQPGGPSNPGADLGGPSNQPKSEVSERKLTEIGKKGEALFYNILLEKAEAMFMEPAFQIIKKPDQMDRPYQGGFYVVDQYNNCILDVRWLNKIKEAKAPKDIEVIYYGQKYVFEVKTTNGNALNAYLSSNEYWELCFGRENYALVFIFDIDSSAPTYNIQWNPLRKIAEGILELIPTKYQIHSRQKSQEVNQTEYGPDEPIAYSGCRLQ